MRIEQWKFIDGTNERYMVSDRGRVLSFARENPTLLRPTKDRFGYLSVGITFKRMVHILVADAFLPNNNAALTEVNHKNSIPSDNNVSNLEWVTPKENVRHAVLRSLAENGGRHWKGKITKEQALFIREKFKKPYTVKEFSAMFSLDPSTVYSILRKETWVI